MKKIFVLILVLVSVQSFGQTWELYGIQINTNGTRDSFFTKSIFIDSIFDNTGSFVTMSVEYGSKIEGYVFPAAFANFTKRADGIWQTYLTPVSDASGMTGINPDVTAALSGKLGTSGNGSSLTGLTKAQVGLSNVDNTSDVNKPVSSATQTALNNKSTFYFGLDAGANDSYTITASPVPASYTQGMIVVFRANTANTTGCSINVNGLGVKTIVKRVSTTPATGDILALMFCMLVYDGTSFVILNPVVN